MGSKNYKTGVRLRSTFKFLFGLGFLVFTTGLTYWLFFHYQVRNPIGIAGIVIFLGIPSLIVVFQMPREVLALSSVWRDNDPTSLEMVFGRLKEDGRL